MSFYNNNPLSQYKTINTSAGMEEASSHEVIQRLMAGALERIATAKGHIERNETAEKGLLISKAISIIGALQGCLDMERGGEISANLDSLYNYMTRQLMKANRTNDLSLLDEVQQLMRDIKSGWDAIPQKLSEQTPA